MRVNIRFSIFNFTSFYKPDIKLPHVNSSTNLNIKNYVIMAYCLIT